MITWSERVKKIKAKGLCVRCGASISSDGSPLCGNCKERRKLIARERDRRKRAAAKAQVNRSGVATQVGYADVTAKEDRIWMQTLQRYGWEPMP